MKHKSFLLLMVALLTTIATYAYNFQSGDLYYDITSDTTVEVTYQEKYSSSNYQGLTTATIPETVTYNGTTYSVTSIGDEAFKNCSSLTSITIPNSVTSIGQRAYCYCTALTSIVVESDNTKYDSRENCNAIIETATNTLIAGCQSTTIPNSVISIGGSAFSGCSSLTSITIPNSVTSIEHNAFWSCSALASITIPNSVTSIGDFVFCYCESLTSVPIPNSVTSIGNYAFFSCNSLTSIIIPNSVTSIGNYACWLCSALTSITIPNSVTSIGDGAFGICESLTSIVVESGNTTYDSRENCNAIIETVTNTLIAGCQSTTIPNSVTSIGGWAFEGYSALTSITIPNSVTNIGYSAFYDCSALTSITIPNSVTSIGDYAFAYCSSLTSITCLATTPLSCDPDCFTDVPRTIPLYVPAESVEAYKAADTWKEFQVQALPASYSPVDLVSITVDGEEIADFDPKALTYDIALPEGTTAIPTIGATAYNEEAQVLLIQATTLPGQASAVVITPDSIQTYTVRFTVTTSSDATLAALQYNGISVPDFLPTQTAYTVKLPYNTVEVPVVTATATHPSARVVIVQAGSLTGQASVVVLSADGTQSNIYTVQFSLAPSTDATLSSLTYDGMLVPFFNADTLYYTVDLPSETVAVPVVDAVANDSGATLTIHQATTLPGEASVEVLAADNTTRQTYTIYFSKKSTPTDISDRPDTTGTDSDKGAEKLLRNGQVLIIRNGKTYNMMGQRL